MELSKYPTLALMKAYGAELTRGNYLIWEFNGEPPAELSAEEEAELPPQFRLINLEEAEFDWLEQNVADVKESNSEAK
jgi:hypothetical protein